MVFLLIPVSSTSNERNFLASYFAMNRPSSPRLELRILRAYVRGSESDGFIIRLASREVQGAKALGQGARAAGPVTARGSLSCALVRRTERLLTGLQPSRGAPGGRFCGTRPAGDGGGDPRRAGYSRLCGR